MDPATVSSCAGLRSPAQSMRQGGSVSTTLTPVIRAILASPAPIIRRLAGPPPTVDGATLNPAVHLMLWLNAKGVGAPDSHDPLTRRTGMEKNTALVMPKVDGVTAQDHVLESGLLAREYRSARQHGPAPIIVYFHGGGWVVGSLDTHDASCRMLARHSGCVVLSVGYRLAPEHPFPAGLDDAEAAFREIHAEPQRFNGLPGAVAVMGDSAGANLAAALCLRTRERGPSPLAQLLIYPAVDLRLTQPSIDRFGDGYLLTKEDMVWYRAQYLPDLALATHPEVSPLLATDLSDLPPAGIWTAGFDPLRDEGHAYAAALREAGVVVSEHCLRDQIHGFFGMGVLPGGMRRIEQVSVRAAEIVHAAI